MRLHRVRFTVRQMMVAVAVAAVLAVGLSLWRRRQLYLRVAEQHAVAVAIFSIDSPMARPARSPLGRTPASALLTLDEHFRVADLRVAYHAALRRKYERAARYPSFPVEPDPPEPE